VASAVVNQQCPDPSPTDGIARGEAGGGERACTEAQVSHISQRANRLVFPGIPSNIFRGNDYLHRGRLLRFRPATKRRNALPGIGVETAAAPGLRQESSLHNPRPPLEATRQHTIFLCYCTFQEFIDLIYFKILTAGLNLGSFNIRRVGKPELAKMFARISTRPPADIIFIHNQGVIQ